MAAAIVSRQIDDPFGLWTVATCFSGYFGGTAPDWLENAWWSRGSGRRLWIAHRTWTHWGVAWIGLLIVCYLNLGRHAAAAPLFGFAAGGIMHLLADWPNPLGVPWLSTQRHSLKWWRSGRCDYFIIAVAWGMALLIADQVWWNGIMLQKLRDLTTALATAMTTSLATATDGGLSPSAMRTLREWLHPFDR